jgi:hypothetical protein
VSGSVLAKFLIGLTEQVKVRTYRIKTLNILEKKLPVEP